MRYSNRAVRKLYREVNCITNKNHLPPASVCAEPGDGKTSNILMMAISLELLA